MRIVVTGGAGFIGSHLCDRLLARGDDVVVIDNYSTGRRDNLTATPRLTIVEGTIADIDTVAGAFQDEPVDVVVHAAASYKDPNDWAEDTRTNAVGTANACRAAMAAGVRRLIYFQTALCYGLHPIEQPITLSHPLRPFESSYAISKTAGESYCMLTDLDVISFRLANAYGPRNLSGPLPTFYQRLTTGQPCFVMDTRRDFIFINDLIDVVVKAVDGRGSRGAYHISSGSDYSIKELFDASTRALGIDVGDVEIRPRGPDDAPTILLDPSLTRDDFDWAVSTTLAEGVASAISYYRSHGVEETYTHLKITGDAPPR